MAVRPPPAAPEAKPPPQPPKSSPDRDTPPPAPLAGIERRASKGSSLVKEVKPLPKAAAGPRSSAPEMPPPAPRAEAPASADTTRATRAGAAKQPAPTPTTVAMRPKAELPTERAQTATAAPPTLGGGVRDAAPPPQPDRRAGNEPKEEPEPAPRTGGAGRKRAGGSGEMLRFARSAGTPAADPDAVADASHIGDQDIAAPTDTRAATTVERSAGNARARGEALPIPEGHDAAKDAPTARAAVARPSPVAVSGEDSTAGARPGESAMDQAEEAQPSPPDAAPVPGPSGLRLWVAGELSDADLERVRSPLPPPVVKPKPKPRRKPTSAPALAELEPSTVTALVAPAPPPRPAPESDGFWGGGGAGDAGLGSQANDTPAAEAGDDVQKAIFTDEGAGWTDITMLDEDVTEADKAQVAVRRTALGVWFAPVDDLVRGGWKVPLAVRALGVTGSVIVEFTIDKRGAVNDVAMIDANVDLELQLAALAAVPAAVPPPPGGTGTIRVRYTFRYGGQARSPRAIPDSPG